MRILLDTNIFIHREDDKIITPELQNLLRYMGKSGVDVVIHPLSFDDLRNDKDEKRRKVMLSKLNSYNILEYPPDFELNPKYCNIVKTGQKTNDFIDNSILYAVFKDAVDFLITEDRGVHKKADRLGISDRIFTIGSALDYFGSIIESEKINLLPQIHETSVSTLDIDDPTFSPLKRDYPGFDLWFSKISKEGRKCWVYFQDNGLIGALMIFKIEESPVESHPPLPNKKRLKIATLKVEYIGNKIGELFLKQAFQYSIKKGINEVYLTHFTESGYDHLVNLIEQYGFYRCGYKMTNGREEDVFLKKLCPDDLDNIDCQNNEIFKKYYPSFYDGKEVKKYILPIQPEYHEKLFTDYPGRQMTLGEYSGKFIIEGNTIKKAYLCHSKSKDMSMGDILLFYNSKIKKEVNTLGVVEKVFFDLKSVSEVRKHVGKRTVYKDDEINEMVKKPLTVILFNWHFYFPKPLPLSTLTDLNCIKRAPQSINKIEHNNYLKIKERSGIDGNFTIDKT